MTHALGGKRALGVHSGAIGDGIADLMEAGVVDNRHKEIDPGITVATVRATSRSICRKARRGSTSCGSPGAVSVSTGWHGTTA
jgi:acetyl-CoA hydrolase